MPDGRLVAVAWALDNDTGRALPTPYRISADGMTFTEQRETGILGQTAKLLPLDENRLLCVYRRVDKTGLWANLVELDGDEWNNLGEIPLWQGAATGMTGERSKSEELSELKFGYPSLLRTSSSEVLVAFWCHEDTVWNIRWVRVGLSA